MRLSILPVGALGVVVAVVAGPAGAGVGPGGALTVQGLGTQGTLTVLPGDGTRLVWSLDIASNTWSLAGMAPGTPGRGASISNDVFSACSLGLVGGGASHFFRAPGTYCSTISLASTPAPVGPGGALATAPGLGGAPADSVFALRGGGTSDFWRYSIGTNTWSTVQTQIPTPGPADDGAALVEVYDNQGFCGGTGFQVAMIRGGSTSDFWCYSIGQDRWIPGPALPTPVGPGAALAQLQGLGRIYLLGGGGTTGFWMLDWTGQWTALASTPGPVGPGGGLVGVNFAFPAQPYVLYALQGGGSPAVWKFDVAANAWSHLSDVPAPPASSFYTVTPCRVFDTREPSGPTSGAPLDCGTARNFTVAGKCGVPSNARAVSLNLTGTGSTAQGNVRLFAAGDPAPLVSTLNYVAGQTRANNAVAPLGTGGQISVLCSPSGTTHVILDVNGYLE